MSYQALARKWRPRQFSDLVGQKHIVQALSHALSQNKLHHALLFSGTRGVGKTTLARIIAKCLNCERVEQATDSPCVAVESACSSCQEIDQGRFVDLIEVDAASRTGVDDMRELMDNVHYAPTRGRTKVYLIDEVHMLSKHAFNALLKTLEEPPPRVEFLFATTEPEKLPITILSRCLHFPLKRLAIPQITQRLAFILDKEALAAEQGALEALAKAADGSMRDALSLLDQAIAFGSGKLTEPQVQDMLGLVSEQQIQNLLAAIIQDQAEPAMTALTECYMQGVDMHYLLESLATTWQAIALEQLVPGLKQDLHGALQQMASQAEPADVQVYYDICLAGIRDLRYAPDPLVGARMCVLRMLAFVPSLNTNAGTQRPEPARTSQKPAAQKPQRQQAKKDNQGPNQARHIEQSPPAVTTQPVAKQSRQQSEPQAEDSQPVAAENNAQPASVEMVPKAPASWEEFIERLELGGLEKSVLRHSICHDLRAEALIIQSPKNQRVMLNNKSQASIIKAIQQYFSQPDKKVEFQLLEAGVENSPAQKRQQAKKREQQQAVDAIQNDPHIKQLQQQLGAKLKLDSIQPISPKPEN